MGKWDGIKSKRILSVMRSALEDDKAFSHVEVVDLIRAALEDGYLTHDELEDLKLIANNSDTMMPRSKFMLMYLYAEMKQWGGLYSLGTNRQTYAADIICSFLKRMGSPKFSKLNRDEVGIDLLMRIANPSLINQRRAGLCGPCAFLYSVATDSPAMYAKFAIDLFEKGIAKIGRVEVEPSDNCRSYDPPPDMSPAEWLTAASLRDSENAFLDFDDVNRDYSAGTAMSEMIIWFQRAGYTHVDFADNRIWSRGAGDIADLNTYYNNGYRVVLRINDKMLYADKQTNTSGHGDHFVTLVSPITATGQSVSLTVFTWGYGKYLIPQGNPLSQSDFLGNLYGYIAAKPF